MEKKIKVQKNIEHGTLLNGMCQPRWEGGLGEKGYTYTYVNSLRCLPETTTTLLIGYAPIQNVMVLKNK